jgi:hypothetical protein
MREKLRKVMVTVLLVYALADLSIPGMCRESWDEPDTGPLAILTSTQQSGGPVSSHGPDADDCFCCCSHILPALPLTLTCVPLREFVRTPQSPRFNSFAITPPHQPPRL